MAENKEKEKKKEILKDIILKLHRGLSVDDAKDRFEKEIGAISSIEIAEIEQSLISEGMSPDEIKKFCNVHALLFEDALKKVSAKKEDPSHPVHLFKLENIEIEKITSSLNDLVKNKDTYSIEELKSKIRQLLTNLKQIELHYTRKEQLLFPYLEKYGFFGPSKVMWSKHDDIRGMLKDSFTKIDELNIDEYIINCLNPLIEEVNGMIFKEENILFPVSMEKLSAGDWLEILKESSIVGYAFIEAPEDTAALIQEFKKASREEAEAETENIVFPTGSLSLKELVNMLNTLPADITFVDEFDRVKYFSENKERIFIRTKSVIGRSVQNCHPPHSIDMVEEILKDFKERKKDSANFWINYTGKFVLIRYFAVRDSYGKYLGTLEVTQDITDMKKMDGEKRLLEGVRN